MKIRMLVSIGGADFSFAPGDETERFSEADALALVSSGQAEPVEQAQKPAPKAKGAPKKAAGQ